ncbi:tetratricopeptide repeat protein [Streptomyces microflavus]|uniref:tetratricopeptide repeat protein n=1 Tax=Streptomyces microflavus TaxID=1919 RepID=UPI0038295AC8
MHDERTGRTPESASVELRRKLEAGLVRARLNKSQLAGLAGLSRGTVQEAFKAGGKVPSTLTVAALARVLKLPAAEMEELRRDAAGGVSGDGPGRPIGQWEPHALEVHPAGPAPGSSGSVEQRVLPGYVRREHDRVLAEAVREAAQGHSRMVVLVGESSTGKTRACWEAVQPLAEKGWRLWHPFDPTRAKAALEELHDVGPRTVVWLNEAQHYLGDRAVGEQVAAAVHALLIEPERAPVLVLGTLWPEYFKQYTALPDAEGEDPHSRVRELLAGRTESVPDAFDAAALAAASVLAEDGDGLLADALTRARTDGRLGQDLAGVPVLLERYKNGSPAARALLEVAMDARRLGVGLHIPQAFLTDAASDYFHDSEWDQLTEDWAEKAYAELAEQVHGKQAPLRRVSPRPQRRPPGPSTAASAPALRARGPVFRLADSLEQHGIATRRRWCPPASFWNAAHTHIAHPDDLVNLAQAAEKRHRLQWAYHLYQRAGDHGDTDTLRRLADMRETAGDWVGAETLYQRAVGHGDMYALLRLATMREKAGDREGAETLFRRAADQGSIDALGHLAAMRERSGDRVGAETLAQRAADRGNTDVLIYLAAMRERSGDQVGAETLYQRAANRGDTDVLSDLAVVRERSGDRAGAETLAQRAADHGDSRALVRLAGMRESAGDRVGAETLARRAADQGDVHALVRLAVVREKAGDQVGAEALAQRAADHGDPHALRRLAGIREKAGDRVGAEILYQRATEHGDPRALSSLAVMREQAGDPVGAETLAQRATDHADPHALRRLAGIREQAGDPVGAETLAQRAADHGNTQALLYLAAMREEAGDQVGAETLYQRAADHGSTRALSNLADMREKAGDRVGAEVLAQRAADHGDLHALRRLAGIREEAGDRVGAEVLAQRAADHGDVHALRRLAEMREKAGDQVSAKILAHRAADHGGAVGPPMWEMLHRLWPYGLDPDGTPTDPWPELPESVAGVQ